jgi:hypothetical protein
MVVLTTALDRADACKSKRQWAGGFGRVRKFSMMKITINGSNYEAEAGERLVDIINRVRKELIMSCSRARFRRWAAWTTQGPHLLLKNSPRKPR